MSVLQFGIYSGKTVLTQSTINGKACVKVYTLSDKRTLEIEVWVLSKFFEVISYEPLTCLQ